MFSHPHISLFATRTDTKLPLCVSPVPDPMTWKQDAFQHPWDNFITYAFSPFHSALLGLVESSSFSRALLDSCGSVLASKRVVHRSFVTSHGGSSCTPIAVEPSCLARVRKFHRSWGPSTFSLGSYPTSHQKGRIFESGYDCHRFGPQGFHSSSLPR